jgi:hypothetical protein
MKSRGFDRHVTGPVIAASGKRNLDLNILEIVRLSKTQVVGVILKPTH